MGIRKLTDKDTSSLFLLTTELNEALGEDQEISFDSLKRQISDMEKQPQIYENFVYEIDGSVIGFISLLHYQTVFHRNGIDEEYLILGKEF